MGEVVPGLGSELSLPGLQAALARALDDPSLQIGLWDQESRTYRDVEDHTIGLPADDDWRTRTPIELGGRPAAAVVHDPSLAVDPKLMHSVAAALRMGMEREQLLGRLRAFTQWAALLEFKLLGYPRIQV